MPNSTPPDLSADGYLLIETRREAGCIIYTYSTEVIDTQTFEEEQDDDPSRDERL